MPASAGAAQWNVNNDTELRYALINAGNSDLLNLTSNVTVIGSDLPAIVKNLTINGNNRVLSGANQYRRLFAYSGSSLIANLNIGQTLARGGSGGSGRSAGGGAGLAGGAVRRRRGQRVHRQCSVLLQLRGRGYRRVRKSWHSRGSWWRGDGRKRQQRQPQRGWWGWLGGAWRGAVPRKAILRERGS